VVAVASARTAGDRFALAFAFASTEGREIFASCLRSIRQPRPGRDGGILSHAEQSPDGSSSSMPATLPIEFNDTAVVQLGYSRENSPASACPIRGC
jgi:hypothetical protein